MLKITGFQYNIIYTIIIIIPVRLYPYNRYIVRVSKTSTIRVACINTLHNVFFFIIYYL